MLKRRLVLSAALPFAVAACGQQQPSPPPPFVPPTPDSLQTWIKEACGYYADIGPLALLILKFVPVVGMTTSTALAAIGELVCRSVSVARTTMAAKRLAAPPQIIANGVVITGRFVN